jgi:hypothetical protein
MKVKRPSVAKNHRKDYAHRLVVVIEMDFISFGLKKRFLSSNEKLWALYRKYERYLFRD